MRVRTALVVADLGELVRYGIWTVYVRSLMCSICCGKGLRTLSPLELLIGLGDDLDD